MHPGSRIEAVYLCREPVDFRKSISGLSAIVEQELKMNPFGTALHVFVNARRDKIRRSTGTATASASGTSGSSGSALPGPSMCKGRRRR